MARPPVTTAPHLGPGRVQGPGVIRRLPPEVLLEPPHLRDDGAPQSKIFSEGMVNRGYASVNEPPCRNIKNTPGWGHTLPQLHPLTPHHA